MRTVPDMPAKELEFEKTSPAPAQKVHPDELDVQRKGKFEQNTGSNVPKMRPRRERPKPRKNKHRKQEDPKARSQTNRRRTSREEQPPERRDNQHESKGTKRKIAKRGPREYRVPSKTKNTRAG